MFAKEQLISACQEIFGEASLFGFTAIEQRLVDETGCRCAVVTLMPYPEMDFVYNAAVYFDVSEELRAAHGVKMDKLKAFLDQHQVSYATPPASPAEDGEHRAAFSYKWAAIHAGLGFIGKNDVFVHPRYAQRVRISCLLIDFDMPTDAAVMESQCGACVKCVEACPHRFISGAAWRADVKRDELVNYKECAKMSKHSGEGAKYLCMHCALACTYPAT